MRICVILRDATRTLRESIDLGSSVYESNAGA